MPKNTYFIKENYKKAEEVREIENEIPSYEEFLKNYNTDEKVNDSYENELNSYGDIGIAKGFGPCYVCNKPIEWTNLYIPCLVADCGNRNLTYQTHSNGCGGNLEVSTRGYIRCKRCWVESHIDNWNFSCSSHGGSEGGLTNNRSFRKALGLTLTMDNVDQVVSDLTVYVSSHKEQFNY